jgi:hypothetical protein
LEIDYAKMLGQAFKQLNRTHQAISSGRPEFAHIPTDRPLLGLVATLDPWYLANSLGRQGLPKTTIPTMVAGAQEVEMLVAIGQRRPVSEILLEIMRPGSEEQTWELAVALHQYVQSDDRNPLLQAAWEAYPFGQQATHRQQRKSGPSPGTAR